MTCEKRAEHTTTGLMKEDDMQLLPIPLGNTSFPITFLISSLVKNNPRATIILGGDFNAGDINWQSNSVPETSSQKTLCTNIIDTLDNNNLSQLVRNPTREENILDLY